MATITISLPTQIAKKVDSEAKRHGFATRSEFIRSLLRQYFTLSISKPKEVVFQEFKKKPLNEVRAAFEKTGKYNKKFIDSLMRGLSESSVYADTTTK